MNYEIQYQKYKKKYLKYNKTGGKDQNIKYIEQFTETECSQKEKNKNFYKFEGVVLDENNKKIGNPNMEFFWKTEHKYDIGKKKNSFINNDENTINYSWKSDQEWHIPTLEELKNIKDYISKENQKFISEIFDNSPNYTEDDESDKKENDNKIKLKSFFKKLRKNIEQKKENKKKQEEDNIIKDRENQEKIKKHKEYTDDINKRINIIKTYIKNDSSSYSEKDLFNLADYLYKCIEYFISVNYAFVVLKELKKEDYFNNLVISTNDIITSSTEPFKPSSYSSTYTKLLGIYKDFNKLVEYTNKSYIYIINELEKIKIKINNKSLHEEISIKIENVLNILECKINYSISYIENTVNIEKKYLLELFYYYENIINLLNSIFEKHSDVRNYKKYEIIKNNIESKIIEKILVYLNTNNIKLSSDKKRILFTYENHNELIKKLEDFLNNLKICLDDKKDEVTLNNCMNAFNKILPKLEYKINNYIKMFDIEKKIYESNKKSQKHITNIEQYMAGIKIITLKLKEIDNIFNKYDKIKLGYNQVLKSLYNKLSNLQNKILEYLATLYNIPNKEYTDEEFNKIKPIGGNYN